MNLELFHDQGFDYLSTIEPKEAQEVTVRLRATKDGFCKVTVYYTQDALNWQEVVMDKMESDATGYYEYWEAVIPGTANPYYYHFRGVSMEEETYYYDAKGVSKEPPMLRNCFVIIPGLKTPDWAKGFLWYSIMPDPFYNGDILNDLTECGLKKTVPWGAPLRGLYEYYGGDIQGIIEKLPYVQDLDVEGVYVNPLWTSESNAGYGPNNYYETSPNYGNEEDLVMLSEKIHQKGMKFMMDAVFSYSQGNSIFVNWNEHQPLAGAFQSQASAYSDMFRFEKWPDRYTKKWGGIENDLGSDLARDLFWRKEDSVLQRYLKKPYDIDGWRFDAIASFAGHDTDLNKIGAEIREYTKKVKPDVLLIGEDYSVEQVMSKNWDSMQNSFFVFTAKLWFQRGQFDQSWLLDRLQQLTKLPRAVGLCLYNNFDLHDVRRLITDYESEKNLVKAVWLLQMTYVGSPVIYYGDEIGATNDNVPDGTRSRNSFNWNPKDWKQDLLALCRNLTNLRKEYTALKNGAFKVGITDNENQLTVFGRWDKNGSVVTMLNQCDYVQRRVLDLKQYNICDGTVVTDYLTGQTYTVQGGSALVDIPAGGSILVTKRAGTHRDIFRITNDACRDKMIMPAEGNYIFLESDEKTEGITPIYGNGAISVTMHPELAGGELFLRDGLAGEEVSIHFTKDALNLYRSGKDTGYTKGVSEGSKISLAIQANGYAVVILDGIVLADTRQRLQRTETFYVGIASYGKSEFQNVVVKQGEAALYDNFEEKHLGNLFSLSKMNGTYEVTSEGLHVQAEECSLLLSEERSMDYTFQARLQGVDGGYAGIIAYADDRNGVALVRDVREGDSLVFGYFRNQTLYPWEVIQGDFSGALTLQLQRTGNVYTAVYKQKEETYGFEKPLMANLSVVKAGLLCSGGACAAYKYACFGSSIKDGHSVNTPIVARQADTWLAAAKSGLQDRIVEQYEIIGDEKEWEYALGGIRRNVSEGLSQLVAANTIYRNFKVQCTLLLQEGAGSAGITMLRSSLDKTLGDGYVLSLTKDGVLSLKHGKEELQSSTLDTISPYGLKINVIRYQDRMDIYIGGENRHWLSLDCVTEKEGYLGFFFDGLSGHVNNYLICNYLSTWLEPVSPWAQNVRHDENGLAVQTGAFVMANQKGYAYTNLQISSRIILDRENPEKKAYAGFLFGAAQDMEPQFDGVLVSIDCDGTLSVSKKGQVQKSVSRKLVVPSVYLTVAVREGDYRVFLNAEKEPVISWKDEAYEGGVVSLVSENSKTGFYHLELADTTKQPAPPKDAGYLITRNGKRIARENTYTEEGTGIVVYQIEPNREDQKRCRIAMDLRVENPESDDNYPVIFVRKNAEKKIGFLCDGKGAYLAGTSMGPIADVNAESAWTFAVCRPNTTYHVEIETEPNSISVKVNDYYLYKDVTLKDCLSGDCSNLTFAPEIVCKQGVSGKTKTIIENICI